MAPEPTDLADLLSALPIGVYLCNAVGRITGFNQKAVEMWGRTPDLGDEDERFCGSLRLYRPDGSPLPHAHTPMAGVLRGAGPILGEEVIIERPDGSRITVLVNIAPLTDAEGSRIGAVNFFQDITERKRAERERDVLLARERAAREAAEAAHLALHETLESITDVFFSLDSEFRLTYLNSRAEELWGKKREELLGRTLEEAVPQAVGSHPYQQLRTAYSEHRYVVFEALSPIIGRWIECCVYPKGDGVSVYFHDISDRRRAEEEREAERQRLRELMDLSPVGVVVIDPASGLIQVKNREFERLTGLLSSGHGQHWSELLGLFWNSAGQPCRPEDSPFARALQGGERVVSEEMQVGTDGQSLPVLVSSTPVYTEDGRLSAVIGVVQDMGPLNKAERLRNEFQGMVTHELRSPLAVIKSSVALAREEVFDEEGERTQSPALQEIKELLDGIEVQADRLLTMIANLLDVSQMEAGAFTVTPEPTSLNQIVEEAAAARGNISPVPIEVQIAEEMPFVNADRARLLQVLDNLLSNALKFSFPAGPVRVSAETIGGKAVVRISNHGTPIPAEKVPRLFKKFSRLSNPGVARPAGHGLGLVICKGIVEAHGGRIWVESSVERQETAFIFTLPLAVSISEVEIQGEGEGKGPVSSDLGKTKKVLIVDDEPQILRFVSRALDRAGYIAVGTTDPAQAVTLLQNEQPDIALLDLRMPGIDGFELVRRFRQVSQLPVIFLSANDRAEDKAEALRIGADDYVTKPFEPVELVARIEAALRRQPRQSP